MFSRQLPLRFYSEPPPACHRGLKGVMRRGISVSVFLGGGGRGGRQGGDYRRGCPQRRSTTYTCFLSGLYLSARPGDRPPSPPRFPDSKCFMRRVQGLKRKQEQGREGGRDRGGETTLLLQPGDAPPPPPPDDACLHLRLEDELPF